jgi:hypothetical protein
MIRDSFTTDVGIEKNREVMVAEATILKQGYKAII